MRTWLVLALLSPCPRLAAQEETALPEAQRLEVEVPALLEHAGVPGLALAIADREGVRWSGAWGARVAGQDAGVDARTVFAAASLSKPVFAYAVLKLVDQEVLALDTPLVEYAPLPDVAHDPRHARLTARHVLSHTTGLPNWRPRGGRLDFQADPGTRWGYSGEGFVLLAHVVEVRTGQTLDALAHELVFEPLGMTSATYVCPSDLENLALPHDERGRPQERPGPEPNVAASLVCTPVDYARFLSALLRGAGLSPALAAEMRRPQVALKEPGVAWGLGLGIEDQPAGPALWQWGHNDGYRAFAWLSPATGRALVFQSNSDEGMLLLRDLVRLATGVERHPALEHLDYESWDSPQRTVRRALEAAFDQGDGPTGLATFERLRAAGPPEAFGESLLNGLGYRLLYADPPRVADAVLVFRRNVALFPDAANPWDSLGEALLEAGQQAEALAAYRRSLELDPTNGNAAGVIERLAASR